MMREILDLEALSSAKSDLSANSERGMRLNSLFMAT